MCNQEGHRKYLAAAKDARTTVWTRVGEATAAGAIAGPHATPKALRHAFVLNATVNSVPLNKVEQWLGNADLRNTPIYGDTTCAEEDWIAERVHG